MKLTPKDLAKALYLATRREPEKKAGAYVKNLVEVARRRGLERTLDEVLRAMPEAMEAVDAESRIIVESARELTEAEAEKAVAAAGVPTEHAEIVRRVVPELVAGVRVRTPQGVLDATARRTLDDLMHAMRRPAEEA